jgi:hypothetical protein
MPWFPACQEMLTALLLPRMQRAAGTFRRTLVIFRLAIAQKLKNTQKANIVIICFELFCICLHVLTMKWISR